MPWLVAKVDRVQLPSDLGQRTQKGVTAMSFKTFGVLFGNFFGKSSKKWAFFRHASRRQRRQFNTPRWHGEQLEVRIVPSNSAPTVAVAAAASSSVVTGTTTTVSVLGADDGGEANLRYYWTTGAGNPAFPKYSVTGNNAAKNTTVTFNMPGAYSLGVVIYDASGLYAVSNFFTVMVNQTLTSVSVSVPSSTVLTGATQQLTATPKDQFGQIMVSPTPVVWSKLSGVGQLNASGNYSAGYTTGMAIVRATAGTRSGDATINVNLGDDAPQTGSSLSPVISLNANGIGSRTGTLEKIGDRDAFRFDVTTPGRYQIDQIKGTQPDPYLSLLDANNNTLAMDDNSGGGGNSRIIRDLTSGTYFVVANNLYDNGSGTYGITIAKAKVNAAPTVAVAAAAASSIVAGTTTTVSVLGADDGGEANLLYYWTTGAGNPAFPKFSSTGTNAAKNTTVTFTTAGVYSLGVVIYDASWLFTVSNFVTVTVNQTLTSVSVSPVTVLTGATQQLTATPKDQFGQTMVNPTSAVWSKLSGVGQLNTSGILTAGYTTGVATVRATMGTRSGDATINVNLGDDAPQTGSPLSPMISLDANGNGSRTGTLEKVGDRDAFRFDITAPGRYQIDQLKGTQPDPYLSLLDANNNLLAADDNSGGGANSRITRDLTSGSYSVVAGNLNDNGSGTYSVTIAKAKANAAPTVAVAATASLSVVTGTTTTLSVLGADDGGEPNLSYSWYTETSPNVASGSPSFSENNTNAAKNVTVTFATAGSYSFKARITDGGGLVIASNSVQVTVSQTLTTIMVSPATVTVLTGATQQFTANANDQFGQAMISPPTFVWAKFSGVGEIDGSGRYSAGNASGVATLQASAGSVSATAMVVVNQSIPQVPTGLTATVTGDTTVHLAWNPAVGASRYSLDRLDPSAGNWIRIYSDSGVQFTDSGLRPGAPYSYRVQAGNVAGDSAYSSIVSATTTKSQPLPGVNYHGGALLQNVEAQAFYLGSDWLQNPSLYQQTASLESFVSYVVNSPYMDMLTQAGYSVGRGTASQGVIVGYSLNKWAGINDSEIRSDLQANIRSGVLAAPDANRLYIVYVEPGVVIHLGNDSSDRDFSGYHGAFAGSDASGRSVDIRYAVIAYPGSTNPVPTQYAFDILTVVTSHELVEAVTDPDVNYKALGWYDDLNNAEIADLTEAWTTTLNGYVVQDVVGKNDQIIAPITVPPSQFRLGGSWRSANVFDLAWGDSDIERSYGVLQYLDGAWRRIQTLDANVTHFTVSLGRGWNSFMIEAYDASGRSVGYTNQVDVYVW